MKIWNHLILLPGPGVVRKQVLVPVPTGRTTMPPLPSNRNYQQQYQQQQQQ